jgi:invasion protein IalB
MKSLIWRLGIVGVLALLGVAGVVEARAITGGVALAQNPAPAARQTHKAAPAAEEKLPQSAQEQTAPQQQQPQEAAAPKIPIRTEISRFDGWVVTCNEFEGGPKTRECSALLEITQQKTNRVVFTWTIAFNNKKQVVALFQTPTGVIIAPGIELRIGKSPERKIPFTSCDTGRCVATTVVDANMLHEMTTSPTAQAVIQGSQGSRVEFNIEMKGFDKAYAALSRP